MLLDNILDFTLLCRVFLAQMLVPHVLDKLRELVPVHQIAVAGELSSLHLHVVLARYLLLFVDIERLRPLLQLLKPVFLVLGQKVLFGVVQDAFGGLWLLELVVGLDQFFNSVSWRVFKLLLPVVEGFGVGIAVFSNDCERLRGEELDVFRFVQLHELGQVQDLLQHLDRLAWCALSCLEALQDRLFLIRVHLSPATEEGDAV